MHEFPDHCVVFNTLRPQSLVVPPSQFRTGTLFDFLRQLISPVFWLNRKFYIFFISYCFNVQNKISPKISTRGILIYISLIYYEVVHYEFHRCCLMRQQLRVASAFNKFLFDSTRHVSDARLVWRKLLCKRLVYNGGRHWVSFRY